MKENIVISDDFSKLPNEISKISKKILIIGDKRVYNLFGNKLEEILEENFIYMDKVIIESCEKNKSFDTLFEIYDKANDIGMDKSWAILSLGGGITGDISGFAASTFKRGIKLIHIPTTLLSQIDSSVGGKTGLNFGGYKNNIGTIYQSNLTYINISCLKTLDKDQFLSAFGELAKYAMIAGGDLYEQIFTKSKTIIEYNFELLQNLVIKCVHLKQSIVDKDLNDCGYRNILNLGHTFGHAVESISNYQILHGEAVLLGLLYSIKLSIKLGNNVAKLENDIRNLIIDLNIKYPSSLLSGDYMRYFKGDKKYIDGKINFVLPYSIGDVRIQNKLSSEIIEQTINDLHKEDFLWI